MNLHYLKQYIDPAKRAELFPLLKPFIKITPISVAKRQELYQVTENQITFVEDIKDAEVGVLTMSWNYYYKTNTIHVAKTYIKEANAAGKKVWSFMSGDFGVKLNLEGDYIVFRNSGHKSKLSSQHLGMPVFINDPLQEIYATAKFSLPMYHKQPIVGFCGQANSSLLQSQKEIAIRSIHSIKYIVKKTQNTPQPIQSTSLIRAKLLQQLELASGVEANFIKRKKYRAGVEGNKRWQHQTTKAFFDNIIDSHYVLCVRGGGNFSVRFYETLAMGRIPIFVNTDCLLPLDDKINWKKHCVWVEYCERKQLAQKVIQFHQQHTQTSLFELMQANRKLWEEKMRIGNFFKTFMA